MTNEFNKNIGGRTLTKDKELRPITFPEVAALLHGILFAYEKVVAELYKGKHRILFPYIIEDMAKVLSSQEMAVVDPQSTLEDNMEGLRTYLSNEEFLKGVSFKNVGEDAYTFEIEECSFAMAGVHEILEMHGGICPFALAMAAILSSVMTGGRYMDLVESKYTDKGSKTLLTIV